MRLKSCFRLAMYKNRAFIALPVYKISVTCSRSDLELDRQIRLLTAFIRSNSKIHFIEHPPGKRVDLFGSMQVPPNETGC